MINYAIKNTRKWVPELRQRTSYLKMFNQALDNFELNKLEERAFTLSYVHDQKMKKASF